jgi:hypothetical protein
MAGRRSRLRGGPTRRDGRRSGPPKEADGAISHFRPYQGPKGSNPSSSSGESHANSIIAEFRAINPECTVPVREFDDGRRIAEVIAICLYLELAHPERRKTRPEDSPTFKVSY